MKRWEIIEKRVKKAQGNQDPTELNRKHLGLFLIPVILIGALLGSLAYYYGWSILGFVALGALAGTFPGAGVVVLYESKPRRLRKTIIALLFGVVLSALLILMSLGRELSLLLFLGSLGMYSGFILGCCFIFFYTQWKVVKAMIGIDTFSIKELLVPIFSALIFWQLFQNFVPYASGSSVAGLITGWLIGYWIVKLYRKRKKKK